MTVLLVGTVFICFFAAIAMTDQTNQTNHTTSETNVTLSSASLTAMNVTINGKIVPVTSPCTLAEQVSVMGYQGKRIAIEMNGDIVPKSQYAATLLHEGDVLEVVVAVGGG